MPLYVTAPWSSRKFKSSNFPSVHETILNNSSTKNHKHSTTLHFFPSFVLVIINEPSTLKHYVTYKHFQVIIQYTYVFGSKHVLLVPALVRVISISSFIMPGRIAGAVFTSTFTLPPLFPSFYLLLCFRLLFLFPPTCQPVPCSHSDRK